MLINDWTRASALYVLNHKTKFFQSIRYYNARVETDDLPNKMYRIRFDGAGGNKSDDFVSYVIENRIILEFTPPYAHQSNCVAEISSKTHGRWPGNSVLLRNYQMNSWRKLCYIQNTLEIACQTTELTLRLICIMARTQVTFLTY